MASSMQYSHHVPPPKTSKEEWESAFQEFLSNGGKVQIMNGDRTASKRYDNALKKTQENLAGGFNPFSKDSALTINKKDFK
jgi:hypothetical protein